MKKFPKSLQHKLQQREQNNALRKLPHENDLIDFASNDYLGFANSEEIFNQTHQYLEDFFETRNNLKRNGATGSRLISGNHNLYHITEEFIANFHQSETALIFNSGYDANVGFFSSVPQRNDIVLYDELCHASIRDGIQMSNAKSYKFQHNDITDLEKTILKLSTNKQQLTIYIVTESVFSMDGDIAPLPELVEVAEAYGAMIMVDDAHGEGVLGRGGRGIVDHFGLHGRVDVEVGTLSKAFGVVGGFISGTAELIDYLRQKARPNLFSSALTVPDVAANLASVEILEESDDLVRKLWSNGKLFKERMKGYGFNIGQSQTPITPVILGEAAVARTFSARLFEEGIFAQAIAFPTVPKGTARIRVMVSAAHEPEDLEMAADVFARVAGEMNLLPNRRNP